MRYRKYTFLSSLIILVLLLGASCNKDEHFTIKGQLVKSCDDQTPIAGANLQLYYACGCTQAKTLTSCTSDKDGNFSFTYSSVLGNGLLIQQNFGTSYKTIIGGIPKNQNVNIGTVHSESNFFAILSINPIRNTTLNDTVFYQYKFDPNPTHSQFKKYVVGPFSFKQVLDTLVFSNAEFYDINNVAQYWQIAGVGAAGYQWRLGNNGNDKYAGGSVYQPCIKYLDFSIDIK